MSAIGSHVQAALQEVGFKSWDATFDDLELIEFEDAAVIGFVALFGEVQSLLQQWTLTESRFLTKYGAKLRRAGDKAWNVYCVFLCTGDASDDELREVRWIEENLERSRKITGCQVQTRDDVTTALLPLLPIVAKPVLEAEDPADRLRRRISAIAPGAETATLSDSVPAADVAELLTKP